MDKIGIIGEFNPFHNGHMYLIDKIKKQFPNSFITAIITTNFTQRGDFSVYTKWDKTKIALNNNIDLVVELPFYFATQSADIFSYASVSILEYLDLDYLIFGSEIGDIEILKNLANTILYHKDFNKLVREYLDLGNNYPAAMGKALYNITNIKLINSNDILAVTYIKTILENDYKIKPLTIKRTNNYLNKKTSGNISSATSIRELYFNNINIDKYIPKNTNQYFKINNNYLDKYFFLLKYKLISEINSLNKYLDVAEGIEFKIKKIILNSNNYQELLDNLKSKRYTYNKLNRMFLHIMLNLEKENKFSINYIRILGFNKLGRSYLKVIKQSNNFPIITNYKEINDEVLKLEKLATIIYLNIISREDLIKEELKSIPIDYSKK